MFGEPRADRFMRKVSQEIDLMDRESHEEDLELAAYDYDLFSPYRDDPDDEWMSPDPDPISYDYSDYDDFDYELSLRT